MDLDADLLSIPGSILLDDLNIEDGAGRSYLLSHPSQTITARSHDELISALETVDDLQTKGKYLAGYIAYDAGFALHPHITSRHKPNVPLLWLGVYDTVRELDYEDAGLGVPDGTERIRDIRLNLPDEEYLGCIERVKELIRAGDVYQVNYTCKMMFNNTGTAAGLFARLRRAHPVCHSAFVNAGDFQVISLSPELFLRKTADKILTRPMKGTLRRGRYCEEDDYLAEFLSRDAKNRAENIMIVDLMRNDLGRICRFGGVEARRLFHVERYGSVLQMCGDVQGFLREEIPASEIMRAAFPPGSITGAPKIRAMEIIDELERESRGVYCGCIGMFEPDGDLLLNVSIRTILQRDGACEMGIGGGITADSDPNAELQEAILKGKFLLSEPMEFDLLETLLYRKGEGYAFLSRHIARMRRSAAYFGRRFPESSITDALQDEARKIESLPSDLASEYRIRLLLSRDDRIETHRAEIEASVSGPIKLLLSSRKTDSGNPFLYHKTTNRQLYDEDLRRARKMGYFDVLYLNEKEELTECAVTNLVLRIDGVLYTPSLHSGLLPGVWRESLLNEGTVTERALTLADLSRATRAIIGNSVRGEIEVQCVEDEEGHVRKSF
jgi:para-aminobenzoate synthetase/4-amino-4-deoxychorismate lyase